MLNLMDYIIIGVLALSILWGYKQGLLVTLGGMISTVAALALAFIYQDRAAIYLQKYFDLQGWLGDHLLGKVSIPAWGGSSPTGLSGGKGIENLAHWIALALSFILLFLICGLILKLLWQIMSRLLGHGLLSGINRLGGMLLLLLTNAVMLASLLMVIRPLVAAGAHLGINPLIMVDNELKQSVSARYLIRLADQLAVLLGIGA